MNKDKTIISLFDHSKVWSKPYKDAGYHVITVDIQDGLDIFEVMTDVKSQVIEMQEEGIKLTVYGILAAPPCTDFAGSGARWWKDKEKKSADYDNPKTLQFNSTVEYSIFMVLATLEIVALLKPEFYCIENPVGRIAKLIPEIGEPWYFNPCDFGDPYTKKTGLYGKFNKPVKESPVLPLFGSMITDKLSSKQKNERSKTPKGFALAFFKVNQ